MGNLQAIPTVTPDPNFNPELDCNLLFEAMDGIGTNELTLIRILANRSSLQRAILKDRFLEMFGESLVDKLRSEVSGGFKEVITSVMDPAVVYDAKQLRRAMRGVGTDEEILIEILCTRTNEQVDRISAAYAEIFGRCLVDDVRDETSGDFKQLLMAMLLAKRDELYEVDEAAALVDAIAIFEAGENRWLCTDENVFTNILATRSYLQLRLIFEKYQDVAGHSFVHAVNAETSGDLRKAYRTIVAITTDHLAYYAQKLYDSMRGLGTDDAALIRHIVGRSEIDLGNIKDKYVAMFGKTLWQDISDDCSGDYKRMLLALIRE